MKSKPHTASEPKYRLIANLLQQEIRKGMAIGAKLPSEPVLAERFGVHVLTIREALRVLQEGGIIQRRRAVGTSVVNPQAGNWVTIACEMDVFSPSSHSLFHRSVIYHLRHFLREAGIYSRVSIGEAIPGERSRACLTAQDFVADIEAGRLSGVLALSTIPEEWWLQKLQKQGVPVVGTNHYYTYRVGSDPWEDLSKSIRCFLDLGRKKIAYIGWLETLGGQAIDEPLVKALDELERCYPVTIRKEWIKGDIYPERPGAGWEEFREIWTSGTEKPDALIIDNEHLLPDIERVLEELNINVPRDLLIICHRTRGNDRVSRFPIIFQENDPGLFASRMVECFLRLYRGEKLATPHITVPRLLLDDALRSHPDFAQLRPSWVTTPRA